MRAAVIDPAYRADDPASPPAAHPPKAGPLRHTHPRTHMTRVIYHLATCSTCQRILQQVPNLRKFTLREIKTEPITAQELDAMKQLAGSYEALFSRRSMKYRPMGLHERTLSEKDYRKYILQEYSFLKRPVAIIGDRIFIGNTKAVVEELVKAAKALK
jgi:arsenate reductase